MDPESRMGRVHLPKFPTLFLIDSEVEHLVTHTWFLPPEPSLLPHADQ